MFAIWGMSHTTNQQDPSIWLLLLDLLPLLPLIWIGVNSIRYARGLKVAKADAVASYIALAVSILLVVVFLF